MYFKRCFLLLGLLLPMGLWAQSEAALANHAQAVQRLQQQHPKATPLDLSTLKTEEHLASCSHCAKELRPTPTTPVQSTANKADLLSEQSRLLQRIDDLRQASPIDVDLLQKYRTALELNLAALQELERVEQKKQAVQSRR